MACLQRSKFCTPVGSRPPKGFDYTEFCSRIWLPGEVYLAGQRIRPRPANGYEYETGATGQTNGRKEPKWIDATGAAVLSATDGSITWTRQPVSNTSLVKTIGSSTWSVVSGPGGLALEGALVINTNGEQKTQAFFNANTALPGIHVVVNEVTFSDGHEDFSIYEVEVEQPAG